MAEQMLAPSESAVTPAYSDSSKPNSGEERTGPTHDRRGSPLSPDLTDQEKSAAGAFDGEELNKLQDAAQVLENEARAEAAALAAGGPEAPPPGADPKSDEADSDDDADSSDSGDSSSESSGPQVRTGQSTAASTGRAKK